MQQRRKLVVGNWKMNGDLDGNAALVATLVASVGDETVRATVDDAVHDAGAGGVAVCVPYPYLSQIGAALAGSSIGLGAQDVSEHERGAYTGEVSTGMLRDFGCRYAIVGHSERRTWFGDTDHRVALKTQRALDAGITPIVCIGETLDEREQGAANAVVARQLDAVVERSGAAALRGSVFAYEPIWAIGTGRTASPAEAQAMHAFIRAHLARCDRRAADEVLILYGGSVKAANASSLFDEDDIDGGLIGGASLIAEEFMGIVRCAVRCANERSAHAMQ